jgi:hypothetical protein
VAGAVSQNPERRRLLQPQRKQRGFAFAGLDRDGGLAGVAGERITGWEAGAAVADLKQQLGGGDHAVLEKHRKIWPSGCSRIKVAIWRSSPLICA